VYVSSRSAPMLILKRDDRRLDPAYRRGHWKRPNLEAQRRGTYFLCGEGAQAVIFAGMDSSISTPAGGSNHRRKVPGSTGYIGPARPVGPIEWMGPEVESFPRSSRSVLDRALSLSMPKGRNHRGTISQEPV
jgi:hypothetical protein